MWPDCHDPKISCVFTDNRIFFRLPPDTLAHKAGRVQMRRLSATLIAAVSVIALTQIASAAPPAPVYNWTGFYAGINAGYGWGNTSAGNIEALDPASVIFLTPSFPFFDFSSSQFDTSFHQQGPFGGIQLGYNWQFTSWVVGFETDIQAADIHGRSTQTLFLNPSFFGTSFPFDVTAQRKLDWFGTVRGRLGFLVTPNLLFYGTGGLAYGHTEANGSVVLVPPGGASISINSGGAHFECSAVPGGAKTCYAGSDSRTSIGWTAGAGLEYMLASQWTAKLEYLHIDLGDQTVTLVSPSPPSSPGVAMNYHFDRQAVDLVRFGLNYKFF